MRRRAPHDAGGGITRSDVNYDGRVSPVASNRLIVQADADGDVCFYTNTRVDLIVDVNAVSFDVGVDLVPEPTNRHPGPGERTAPGRGHGIVRVAVPEAAGGKTVIGQLTVDRASAKGYVTAYGCDDIAGRPTSRRRDPT